MFPADYFAPRFFNPRYFPKVGEDVVLLDATGDSLVRVPRRQRTAVVRGHERTAKVPRVKRGGIA